MFKFRNIKILLLSSMFCILVVGIGFYSRAGAQGSGPSGCSDSVTTGCIVGNQYICPDGTAVALAAFQTACNKGGVGNPNDVDHTTGRSAGAAACDNGTYVTLPSDATPREYEAACAAIGAHRADISVNYGGDCTGKDAEGRDVGNNKSTCGIIAYLVDFINILSGLVGIVCVVMIAVWGLQYTVSRDNPQMVAQARQRMVQTVLALVGYLFIYAFLQWIVPGGVLPG